MRGVVQPERMLRISRHLCSEIGIAESEQESLRFAVVCAYYAVFHGLCRMCADALAGDETEQRGSERGWLEVYRFLSHTAAREACNRIKTRFNSHVIYKFAKAFTGLQKARELANYSADGETDVDEVSTIVEFAAGCVELLNDLSKQERVEFAIFLTMKVKGVKDARERWLEGHSEELFYKLEFS